MNLGELFKLIDKRDEEGYLIIDDLPPREIGKVIGYCIEQGLIGMIHYLRDYIFSAELTKDVRSYLFTQHKVEVKRDIYGPMNIAIHNNTPNVVHLVQLLICEAHLIEASKHASKDVINVLWLPTLTDYAQEKVIETLCSRVERALSVEKDRPEQSSVSVKERALSVEKDRPKQPHLDVKERALSVEKDRPKQPHLDVKEGNGQSSMSVKEGNGHKAIQPEQSSEVKLIDANPKSGKIKEMSTLECLSYKRERGKPRISRRFLTQIAQMFDAKLSPMSLRWLTSLIPDDLTLSLLSKIKMPSDILADIIVDRAVINHGIAKGKDKVVDFIVTSNKLESDVVVKAFEDWGDKDAHTYIQQWNSYGKS